MLLFDKLIQTVTSTILIVCLFSLQISYASNIDNERLLQKNFICYANNYSGDDVGSKINKAINDVFSHGGGKVFISTFLWRNANFQTGIRLKSGVHLIFPGPNIQAIYTGNSNALELRDVRRARVSGFGLQFNSKAKINAVLLTHAFDNIFDGGTYLQHPPGDGIVIDAGNKGAYHNVFRGPIRITHPGGSHIRLIRTGKVHPNANYFDSLVLNSPQDKNAAISIEAGYSNSFSNVYIQSGSEKSWAIYHNGWGWNQIENITIDGDMAQGITVAGGVLFLSHIKNNAQLQENIKGDGNIIKISSTGNLSVNNIILNGSMKLGTDNAKCSNNNESTLRYEKSLHKFQGCNGKEWINLN